MRNRATLIESLETYRQSIGHQADPSQDIDDRVLMAWIFHDNLLEGRTFKPHEIQAALKGDDQSMPSYLRPLLEDIRSYRLAIKMVTRWASEGESSFHRDHLDVLHRHLVQHEPAEGAKLRKNSPVHRDYHQKICSPREVTKRLNALFIDMKRFNVEVDDVLSYAARLQHQLMFIYPFRRQPGVLARLFTNQFMMMHNYPPLILAAHERGLYYDALASHDHSALTQLFYQAAWRYLDSIYPPSKVTLQSQKRATAI